ncbi:acetyltransferase [Vibrio ishigakensis]|uniref:Acetyltransferase n=1 Tax=Vibrio ishigakensis TaxID=1481914 RepID=A0A0B8Q975_9VIBR|nr:acetyltransferase [Vibrio ishigakensis]
MISYQPTTDFKASSQITYNNMRTYYEHYGVNWERSKIEEQIQGLQNWDVLMNGEVVGAIRLQFDAEGCYLRDLQVSAELQGQGIGREALAKVEELALQSGADFVRLRVFKISPAYQLYLRAGYAVDKQEDNFYYMSKLAQPS